MQLPETAARQREALYRRLANLTTDQPEKVKEFETRAEHYAKVQREEARAVQVEVEAKRKKLLARMTVDRDELEKITFYTDRQTPRVGNTVHLYIGEKPNVNPWLRMKVRYWADDWLFVRGFTAYADGQKFERFKDDWDRDNASGDIWEWIDVSPEESDLAMLKALAHWHKPRKAPFAFMASSTTTTTRFLRRRRMRSGTYLRCMKRSLVPSRGHVCLKLKQSWRGEHASRTERHTHIIGCCGSCACRELRIRASTILQSGRCRSAERWNSRIRALRVLRVAEFDSL